MQVLAFIQRPEDQERLRAEFQKLDKSGQGEITLDELCAQLKPSTIARNRCKLRKRPSASRSATSKGSFFWTMMFDPDTLDILTDGPVTTLVAPDDNNNSSANADEHPDGMEAEDAE